MTKIPVFAFAQQRLEAILDYPDGWGPPRAVELQVLLLVELLHVIDGRSKDHVDGTARRWQRHIFEQTKIEGPLDLSGKLGLEHRASPEFVAVIRTFLVSEGIEVK